MPKMTIRPNINTTKGIANERQANERFSNDEIVDRKLANERFSNGELMNGGLLDKRLVNGRFSNGEILNDFVQGNSPFENDQYPVWDQIQRGMIINEIGFKLSIINKLVELFRGDLRNLEYSNLTPIFRNIGKVNHSKSLLSDYFSKSSDKDISIKKFEKFVELCLKDYQSNPKSNLTNEWIRILKLSVPEVEKATNNLEEIEKMNSFSEMIGEIVNRNHELSSNGSDSLIRNIDSHSIKSFIQYFGFGDESECLINELKHQTSIILNNIEFGNIFLEGYANLYSLITIIEIIVFEMNKSKDIKKIKVGDSEFDVIEAIRKITIK